MRLIFKQRGARQSISRWLSATASHWFHSDVVFGGFDIDEHITVTNSSVTMSKESHTVCGIRLGQFDF